MSKVYLGDAVYADHDGYAIHLTTENGAGTTNAIVLEPEVYEALLRYVGELRRAAPAADPEKT